MDNQVYLLLKVFSRQRHRSAISWTVYGIIRRDDRSHSVLPLLVSTRRFVGSSIPFLSVVRRCLLITCHGHVHSLFTIFLSTVPSPTLLFRAAVICAQSIEIIYFNRFRKLPIQKNKINWKQCQIGTVDNLTPTR